MGKMKVFLGGTCNGSKWREKLIPHLEIDYFNPVVENWNEKAKEIEIKERQKSDYCLYVLTPKMTGFYSIAELVDDSNKKPEKTILCIITEDDKNWEKEKIKSLKNIKRLVERNGAKTFNNLEKVINFLNNQNNE